MRCSFFLIAIYTLLLLGCTPEKELQPKNFFIPDKTVALLKIDDKTITKELFWNMVRSGQWEKLFQKGSSQIMEIIQHKEKYGLSTLSPLYLFTYQQNDSIYKTGFVFPIDDTLKLQAALPFQNSKTLIESHIGVIDHQHFYLFINTDTLPKLTAFTDSLPDWTKQYSITGVLYNTTTCSALSKSYLGIQFQDNIINVLFSSGTTLNESYHNIEMPEGFYIHTTLNPLLSIDTCSLSKYHSEIKRYFTDLKVKEALLNSNITLHWLGWDSITTKEYQTVVNEEFETILKLVYKSHSYPLLKIQTPNDTTSSKLLQWAIHQKIIKKQSTQKYMCVLGAQKSYVYVNDSSFTYLPEKYPALININPDLLFSYQPGTLKGTSLADTRWKKAVDLDLWASEYISKVSVVRHQSDYQLTLQFKSDDFALLSLFKFLHSGQEQINAHNLVLP
ncbi:MAG: hypothetical protein U0U66_06930 [Cytophagaceae bacterium]